MVLAASHGISRVPRYSGTDHEPATFRLRGCHPLWPTVPGRSTTLLVGNSLALRPDRPYNPDVQAHRFGLFRVRSPLLAESLICFLFLRVLRWFTSPRSLPRTYGFSPGYPRMTRGGLPHSEISGSKPVCGSPKLFAAYHVLHRLLAPRHSPYALSSLTIEPGTHAIAAAAVARCRHMCLPRAHESPAATTSVPVNTHCVCGQKNYRLQDIQLSKNPLPPGSFSRAPTWRNLVENTGLEPVTSWLQTRRSPS